MTVLLTVAYKDFVIVANDSATTRTFPDGVEFDTDRKWYVEDGVGCVTWWGERVGNKVLTHLREQSSKGALNGVYELSREVNRFLVEEYAPHEAGLGDTGYHVAGFTPEREVRLYHIFYNTQGSPGAFESRGAYNLQDQSPEPGKLTFLYNGRNDLVHPLVMGLLDGYKLGQFSQFPLSLDGLHRFAHFVLAFVSALTPEVSPPFQMHTIWPDGHIVRHPTGELPAEDRAALDELFPNRPHS